MSICTGFRPANYIQAGDEAVYSYKGSRDKLVKVLEVNKETGISKVKDNFGVFEVPTNTLRRFS